MDSKLLSQYRFKFYLNASHSIIINGRMGAVHPHTWEIRVDVLVVRDEFTQFGTYEKVIDEILSKYQNQTMNNIEPFDKIVPTLENIIQYFGDTISEKLRANGGELMIIEGSETPTRSFLIDYRNRSQYLTNIREKTEGSLDKLVDDMLRRVLE